MRQVLVAMAIVAVGAGSTACATKKYVNTRVDDVNTKVATLSESIEETQERTRKNEARIGEVDQKADAANAKAGDAAAAADRAHAAAETVDTRVEAMDKANKRLVYEVVLTDDNSKFDFGRNALADEVKTEIDKIVNQVTADPKNIYLEIEGHTDSVGPTRINERLGLERAEAVKRYLYEQHNIPLHKMNVISFGESKPVAPNQTREGRAQNRRVVIKVLT
jgi:outer membrane protein OmpA-like peptidoglycan-associated protein